MSEKIEFVEKELIKLFKRSNLRHCIIVVLFRGKKLPLYCIPMIRYPKPKLNISINKNNKFLKIYSSALKINPAIRDGAILIQTTSNSNVLKLKNFSVRLYPVPCKFPRERNKGSGYNSAFDFSCIKRVECVYYGNKDGLIKFINGQRKKLL